MPQAVWNGEVIADSEDTVVVDGNHYFPAESLREGCFRPSSKTSVCGWKGTAKYFNISVNNETNSDAAWCYPEPKPEAESLRDRVAFWKGVEVKS